MKKVMIIFNIVGMISTFISLFCNFIRGEGAFIFYFLVAPLWGVLILNILSFSYIKKFKKDKLKKQILWILIVNSIITLTYYIFCFYYEKASIIPFGVSIAIAFLINITLMLLILFSRKIFLIVYTIFILLFIVSFTLQMMIFHANRYEFSLSKDGSSYIIEYNYIEGISITIPSTYKNLPITQITGTSTSHSHVRYWQNISTINFEKDSQIVIIDYYAFFGSEAKKINLSKSVLNINESAFALSEIVEMNIPNRVTYIGLNAFESCRNLRKVIIPKSVTTMENDIFKNCENITIYCETESKPTGWSENWASGIINGNIVWGYKG